MNLTLNLLFLFFISIGCTGAGPGAGVNELEQILSAEGCSSEIKDSYMNSIEQLRGQISDRDIEIKINGLIRLIEKNGC